MSAESLGDIAERMAQKLTTEVSAPLQEATAIAEEAALLEENNLLTKIRFSWRPEDRAALERIRIAADAEFEQAFGEALNVIDEFFMQLRIPMQRDGQIVKGADGRIVWQVDDDGRIIEDWQQLTGQDIEQTLVNLGRVHMFVAPQVNQLFLEALFARHSAQDSYDEAWSGMMDGTQGDRTARSNRESRHDRYHAYFRFYMYSVAKTFLDEITAFQKLLSNIRYWRTQAQK